MSEHRASDEIRHIPVALGFALGFGLFLPIGVAYLLLLIGLACPWILGRRWRTYDWPDRGWLWILALFLAWPVVRASFGWHEESGARFLHHLRIVLTIWVGLTLPDQARKSIILGGLWGALCAIGVVLVNLAIPLPDWRIWHNLLEVHGNASSQKWIAMAAIAGAVFATLIRPCVELLRGSVLAMDAIALAFCVAWFSVSRNAHLLLLALPAAGLLHRRIRFGVLIPALGAALTTVALLGISSPNVSQRLTAALKEIQGFPHKQEAQGSVTERLSMFSASITMIKEAPLLGHGPGAWRSKWAKHSGTDPAKTYNNPHNDFLLWWLEEGLPGLALLLLILIRLARDCWTQQTAQGASGWVMVVAITLTATVNAPFRDAQIGMMLLLIAAALSVRPSPKPLKSTQHTGRTPS